MKQPTIGYKGVPGTTIIKTSNFYFKNDEVEKAEMTGKELDFEDGDICECALDLSEIQSFFKTRCSVSGLEKVGVYLKGGHYLTYYIEYEELLDLWSLYKRMTLNSELPVFGPNGELIPYHLYLDGKA